MCVVGFRIKSRPNCFCVFLFLKKTFEVKLKSFDTDLCAISGGRDRSMVPRFSSLLEERPEGFQHCSQPWA